MIYLPNPQEPLRDFIARMQNEMSGNYRLCKFNDVQLVINENSIKDDIVTIYCLSRQLIDLRGPND